MPDPPSGNPLGLLHLRPLGGTDDEVTAVHPGIESITAATFDLPNPTRNGSANAARLLRDAARLSVRSGVGPFRSFARIGCDPRPYQLVPLLLALRQETVRLLIADDVGIGKTVEASLIARELMDRGEVPGFTVLCPPHLTDQWQCELHDKFHLDPVVVSPGTVGKLERQIAHDQSLFDRFPVTIVSLDFIKTHRRREDFLRACPPLVIVDEAHGCAFGGRPGQARQARHELLRDVAADEARHLVLVTATPHSGNENAFRSLLELLDPTLAEAVERDTEANRERLARHLVQRRRGDIAAQDEVTTDNDVRTFPDREDTELTYSFSDAYENFFNDVLAFTRESVNESSLTQPAQRVRWWSALGLLRSIVSSPAAAAATLRNRAANLSATTAEEADRLGAQAVLDHNPDDQLFGHDLAPGAIYDDDASEYFSAFADRAEALAQHDGKLAVLTKQIKKLVKDGFHPVIFCKFIPTAEYVAQHLKVNLTKTEVYAITGLLPPEERESRIHELSQSDKRVLVCTDCLSEGINLQRSFDAAVHYDLAWNPTRLEQREGRVDRFLQTSPRVRVVTLFGEDNPIDGIVLDVLLRKHRQIRKQLGSVGKLISWPVSGNVG